MAQFTVIDFFCGAGGFSEGFRQEGFQICAGVDNWKPAIDTFNFNFGLNCEPQDISEFERSIARIEALPDTDVIIGSPPCVSFSSSNRSGKADKTTGLKLTKIFLKIVVVKKHSPGSKLKAWFMENVTNSRVHLPKRYTFEQLGLSSWAKRLGFDPQAIAVALDDHQSVINAADYGVPQTRLRVFTGEIIGEPARPTPATTHQAPGKPGGLPTHITLAHIRTNLPSPGSDRVDADVKDPLYPGLHLKQSQLTDQFYDTGLYVSEWKGSRYLKTNHPYMGPMSFPEREDRPSRTITATKIGNSREAIIYRSEFNRQGDGEYRTATVREAATLMGFPITFQFLGSEGNKWTLVGNAVCPPVSRAFAKLMRVAYDLPNVSQPILQHELLPLDDGQNLNTFTKKNFNSPPRSPKGSRFRRHPFKDGNLTVTLSNYSVRTKQKLVGRWQASVQYGTGDGFVIQTFRNGHLKKLEPIIRQFEGGDKFLDVVNNGFSKKVAPAALLQDMYESHRSHGDFLEPTELIDALGPLIDDFKMNPPTYQQGSKGLFKKKYIPKKQVMALYAIGKICAVANGEEK